MAHKNADWEALFYALRAGSNKVTEESGFMEDEECSAYADKCAKAIYEMALECKNHRNPVNSSKSIKSSVDKQRVKEELDSPYYDIKNPERYYDIQFDINWEDIALFAISWNKCIDIDPREIVSVEYDDSVPASYQDAYNMDYDAIDGAYLVKFKDGTSKSYGWTYGGDKLIPMTSRKPIKSDFDDYGNWVDDEKPIKKEDMHGSFRKLSKEEHDELKPQVEEELDRWMSRKHFGLDKEVYDETVEYIISLFGEDNYAPKDVKEAVSSWYNDTLDSFPEMLKGKGDNRKIASAAYLKQIKSSHCIKSSRKPIKSSLSDVNKALGFTDKDIEEDGKIHITTDLGEFVVDYVNDEYIVSYDGEERTFTEYKDTVEEVIGLFNKLCNEEVEFLKAGSFDKA